MKDFFLIDKRSVSKVLDSCFNIQCLNNTNISLSKNLMADLFVQTAFKQNHAESIKPE